MDNQALNLPIGSTLQLQATTVPENAPRLMVRMLGYLPGESLIVSAPLAKGKASPLREGQQFIVRLLQGDSILGFVTKVIQTSLKPYPHLHLEYPTEFEHRIVRNAVRVSTDIPVTLRNTEEEDTPEHVHEASIVDLSETGAKISVGRVMGDAGAALQLKFSLDVLDQAEEMTLVADIRNVLERQEESGGEERTLFVLGAQFRDKTRFQDVLLHAWVMHQLAINSNGMD